MTRVVLVIDDATADLVRGWEQTFTGKAWAPLFEQIAAQLPDPKPKPAEPTEFGAMVKDRAGLKWIRCRDGIWHCSSGRSAGAYAEIDAVEVVAR